MQAGKPGEGRVFLAVEAISKRFEWSKRYEGKAEKK